MNPAGELREQFGFVKGETQPNVRREGDAFVVGFPPVGITVEVTAVEMSRSDAYSIWRVTSTNPGTTAVLHQARVNLTGTAARSSLVKYLAQRYDGCDWSEIVEQVCRVVLDAAREGQPTVKITDVPHRETARFRVAPLVVEGFPNIIFGPGGSGKSMLAAMIAVAVHGGWNLADLEVMPGKVLICDWELDDVTYREVAEQLCNGFGIPLPDFDYRQCSAPLSEEGAAIGRFAAREGIDLIIADSLGFAIGGDKTSQELTMRMFSAMRAWRRVNGSQITTLCVDHVTNDEGTANRPYGSVYTQNAARALWRVRANQEEGSHEMTMGLFQTKANFGKQPPVGFHVSFGDGATSVCRRDVNDMAEMDDFKPASMRIKTAILASGHQMTKAEIVEVTGLKDTIVAARLSDLLKRGDVVRFMTGGQSSAKWAMASDQAG